MRCIVVAIGQRMPAWVEQGWEEYQRRFTREMSLELRQIAAQKRGRNADIRSIRERESKELLAAVPDRQISVALDEGGQQWSTRELAQQISGWMQQGRNAYFLVGGPDGITADGLAQCGCRWSLGRLTLPHPLVRIILAEQLYRAWSMIRNHPYHRD